MATAITKLHDEFLSCIICTEVYQDPCTLVCGHTFCRGCLAKYTKTQQDAIKAKSILCPNCRQMTKVTNPGRQVEDWVKQIKPSFLIQGLMDSFAYRNDVDVDFGNQCFSCLQHEEKAQGSSHCMDCDVIFCCKCVKSHIAIPATSHHVMADITESIKVTKKRMVICKSHNSVVEFCCKDCQKAICPKCILDHRKCDSVVTLESMVPEMKSVIGKNRNHITKQLQQTKTTIVESKTRITGIESQKNKIHSKISKVSQKVVHLVKQMEKQLAIQVDDIAEKQTEELKAHLKSKEIDMQMYQQYREFIDQVLTAESEMDMFDMYQMCQSGAVRMSTDKETMNMSSEGEITFEEESDQQKMSSHLHLGRVRIIKQARDQKFTPTFLDIIDMKTEGDTQIPDPVDVTVVDVNGIETVLITDYINECLKSFYITEGRKHHSSLKMKRKPWSMTRLYENQVAVSFKEHNGIIIVEVTPDLVLLSDIITQKKYRCLTTLNDSTLVAGCNDPPSLDILNTTGRVVRSINFAGNLIRSPSSLCTTHNGNILVSDKRTKSVYCLTPEGDVVFNHSPTGDRALEYPRGVTTSGTGDVLLVDLMKDKVIHLTSEGDFVCDILTSQDNIKHPYSIFLNTHKLFLVQYQELMVFKVNET